MPSNKSIRQRAADILKGILPQAFGITAIFFLAYFFVQLINIIALPTALKLLIPPAQVAVQSGVSLLFSFFFLTPLTLGIMRFFWRRNLEADDSVGVIFYYFSGGNYKKALKYSLSLFLRAQIFATIATVLAQQMLPRGGLLHEFVMKQNLTSNSKVGIIFGFTMLALALSIFAIFRVFKYFLAPYLMINDEDLSVKKAFNHSAQMMRGGRLQLFGFYFSFLPWLLLCLTILPIIYVYPLVMMSGAVYAKYQIQACNQTAS